MGLPKRKAHTVKFDKTDDCIQTWASFLTKEANPSSNHSPKESITHGQLNKFISSNQDLLMYKYSSETYTSRNFLLDFHKYLQKNLRGYTLPNVCKLFAIGTALKMND